jgi:hypothetical protein
VKTLRDRFPRKLLTRLAPGVLMVTLAAVLSPTESDLLADVLRSGGCSQSGPQPPD